MSTNFNLTDSLPKDSSGQRALAWTNDQTSQLDYALPRGVGASTTGSKILAFLGVATATQSSKVESLHPGINLGATFIDSTTTQTSPVSSGRFKLLQATNWGELYATPAPRISATLTAGSKNTVKVGSAVLHSFGVSWSGINLGTTFTVSDNTTFLLSIVGTSAAGHADRILPLGGLFISSSITLQRLSLDGAASLTVSYS